MSGIFLSGTSEWEFVIIHGYTSGPTEFAEVSRSLNEEFDAEIWCPLLPGHGTTVNDLEGLSLENLIHDVEKHVVESVRSGKKVVLVGLSLGAQMALYLASQYPVAAVIAVGTTHALNFPFSLPGLELITLFKRRWKKDFSPEDLRRRANAIYYREMPADGLSLSRELRTLVDASAPRISAPVLFIHSSREKLADPNAITRLARTISSPRVVIRLLDTEPHNIFFSDKTQDVINEIHTFMRSLVNEAHHVREKATAIVPAYNEAPRIGAVLNALLEAPSIDEIIVVNDGSTDATARVLDSFPHIRVITHAMNRGKGASIDTGVQAANNDVLFFCDADLVGFQPEFAEAIIAPVVDNSYALFIGMSASFTQRTIRAWGLNSGQRSLRKGTWQALAPYFKQRFRLEANLNHFVRQHTRNGLGWKLFDYKHTIKERKHGLWRGTVLRWWMNVDVAYAYALRLLPVDQVIPRNTDTHRT